MDKVKDGDDSAPRRVLKLKAPLTRARTAEPAPASAVPRPTLPQPRDAGSWADVYKRKMQADMDALGFGVEPGTGKGPRR